MFGSKLDKMKHVAVFRLCGGADIIIMGDIAPLEADFVLPTLSFWFILFVEYLHSSPQLPPSSSELCVLFHLSLEMVNKKLERKIKY